MNYILTRKIFAITWGLQTDSFKIISSDTALKKTTLSFNVSKFGYFHKTGRRTSMVYCELVCGTFLEENIGDVRKVSIKVKSC